MKLSCENRSAAHATSWVHTFPSWQQIDVTHKARGVLRYGRRQYDIFWTVSQKWDALLGVLNLLYLFRVAVCSPVSHRVPLYTSNLLCPLCFGINVIAVFHSLCNANMPHIQYTETIIGRCNHSPCHTCLEVIPFHSTLHFFSVKMHSSSAAYYDRYLHLFLGRDF